MPTTTNSVTLESFSSLSLTGSNTSINISKPTGLSEGDLMVAGVLGASDEPNEVANISATGWTKQDSSTSTFSVLSVFYKEADASDVIASNFTFNFSGASDIAGGVILRISSWAAIDTSSSITDTDNSVTIPGITPSTTDSFLILFGSAFERQFDDVNFSFSSYSLTNNDPAWTEQYEHDEDDFGNLGAALAFATAERSEKTATGDAAISITGTPIDESGGILLSISPIINGTFADSGDNIEVRTFPVISMADIEIGQDELVTNGMSMPVWTNQTRNSTTWTNQNKS